NDDPLTTDDGRRPSIEAAPDDPTLRLLAEELQVAKETLETGRVRVSTQTHQREALIRSEVCRGYRLGRPGDRGGRDRRAGPREQDGACRRGSVTEEDRHGPCGDRPRQDPPPASRNRARWTRRQGHPGRQSLDAVRSTIWGLLRPRSSPGAAVRAVNRVGYDRACMSAPGAVLTRRPGYQSANRCHLRGVSFPV